MNKETPKQMAFAALLIIIVLFAALIFGGMVIMATNAKAHEEPTGNVPPVYADSVRVQLEIDADGDGVWEVRHIFDDKEGVWEVGPWGTLRVTTTMQTDSMAYADTDLYTFRLHKSSEVMWRRVATEMDSTLSAVLLGEFSQFGQSYGDSLYTDPSTGELIFQSPRYNWFLIPRDGTQ